MHFQAVRGEEAERQVLPPEMDQRGAWERAGLPQLHGSGIPDASRIWALMSNQKEVEYLPVRIPSH